MRTLDDLFDGRVVVCPSGCWLWTGADSGDVSCRGGGYGKFKQWIDGEEVWHYVHRWVYKKAKGPIPKRWQVDHLCARWGGDPFLSRRCCNPDHLEAVPHIVNQYRKIPR